MVILYPWSPTKVHVHCYCTNQASLHPPFVPIKYPLIFKQPNVSLPVMDYILEIWPHDATIEKLFKDVICVHSKIFIEVSFDQTGRQKETFTPLHRVQTFLHPPRPSCICKDNAELLIQPSCLSGSRSISSAARLTWMDDLLASLSTLVPFSFSMDICTRTSGSSSRAYKPGL